MFGLKRIVIAQHERGVYLKDRSIVKILEPGIYRVFDLLGRVAVEVHNLTVPEFNHPYVDVLVKENRELVDKYFQFIELGEYEVGLVYKNGKLTLEDILDLGSSAFIRVYIFGYDKFSGSRRVFLSKKYFLEDVRSLPTKKISKDPIVYTKKKT